ncbi:GNAT family N-acetyltransferase [Microvirga sp. 3-52]|uniref:GNAT family N-acetyltransferase n=1 Tax=Microvirga sp. 3-52 TaxID=2792425 RepID=UPI001AC96107|nr:GNAT family N-acetyltransferase [Microvirga sp. 3-52]MBO1909411.1 GNAT family N-acetyltransferase [Microvirga sp. 3-52]MBS7455412.1 GNAT family N-acetyltransferase [Microvirga sp. 3-52]
MDNATVRLALPGDEDLIDAFLAQHADSSLFLRSFLARGGLVDEGKPLQGTYAIAVMGGQVAGVALHTWNGIIYLQAPECAAALVRLAVETTGRPLIGLGGPCSQVEIAHVGLGAPAVQRRSPEDLFALNLSDLIPPAPLGSCTLSCRRAEERDLDLLRDWRFGYEVECTGFPDEDATRAFAAQAIEGHVARGEAFLLEVDGTPASLCTHNARVRDHVQIGGVWTPLDLRGRGYARRVVAGALRVAEQEGVVRAVLFTENPAARRSYEALGFRQVGEFGVIVLAT